MHKVKAVLFDLGETLAKVAPISETYKRVLEAHGIVRSLEEIASAWDESSRQLSIREMARLGGRFWAKRNLLLLEHLGIRENASSLAEAIDREWWDHAEISLYPEVLTVLSQLKDEGLKIGVISNSLVSDIKTTLPKLGLKNLFDVEVGVDAVGKMKPDKEIFMYAIEKLGLQPHEVLFVGDSVEIDYEGARSVGLKALLIDRENKVEKQVEKIRSLEEILAFILE